MGIQYAGGTIVNATYTTGSSTMSVDVETQLLSNLATAGWTNTQTPATDTLTFVGQPTDGQTVTLDSGGNQRIYTFKNALSAANQVLIDANLAASIDNLKQAINHGAGEGTKYGTGTTINGTMSATATATTLTVSYKTGGSDGNQAPVSTTVTGATWAASTLSGGLNSLLSAKTPQGLQMRFIVYVEAGSFYNPGAKLRVKLANRYTDFSMGGLDLSGSSVPPATTQFRIIANKYQFFHFQVGSRPQATAGGWIAGGVPYLPTFMQPIALTAATNATPIVCTSATAHGLSTGHQVRIAGAVGNTAANGNWTVTVVDASNFSLNTSVGNGTYTANSAYFASITAQDRIVDAGWLQYTSPGAGSHWGGSQYCQNFSHHFTNNFQNSAPYSDNSAQVFLYPITTLLGNTSDMPWYNNSYLMLEPVVVWGYQAGTTGRIIGQLWDAVVIRRSVSLDTTASFDTPAHTFFTVGADGTTGYSLQVAVT